MGNSYGTYIIYSFYNNFLFNKMQWFDALLALISILLILSLRKAFGRIVKISERNKE